MVNAVHPDSAVDMVNQMTAANNAWSAEQAQIQRDWQERMSNTAHQREVADLLAAGLNPANSASSNGASTPAGAKGDTDTSGVASLMSYFMQTTQALINSQTQMAVADKTTAMNELIARLQMQNAHELQDDAQDWNASHPSGIVEAINAVIGAATNRDNELSAVNALNKLQQQLSGKFESLYTKFNQLHTQSTNSANSMNTFLDMMRDVAINLQNSSSGFVGSQSALIHDLIDAIGKLRGGTSINDDGFSGTSGKF